MENSKMLKKFKTAICSNIHNKGKFLTTILSYLIFLEEEK